MRAIPDGLTLRIEHRRPEEGYGAGPVFTRFQLKKLGTRPAVKGGVTRAALLNDAGQPLAVGYAFCGPKDNFSRRLGREIAVGRAVNQLEQRKEIEA